jgi:hypothetical protein
MADRKKPGRAERLERQMRCLALRRAGLSYRDIAREVGYKNPGAAHKAVMAVLEEERTEAVEAYRKIESRRLHRLLTVVWSKAVGDLSRGVEPDLRAVDRALQIIDRLCRVEGVYAPQSVREGGDPRVPTRRRGAGLRVCE